MKVHAKLTIYIFTAQATLDVCSLNPASHAKPVKMPQGVPSARQAQHLHPRIVLPFDHANTQRRLLASPVFAARKLQNP